MYDNYYQSTTKYISSGEWDESFFSENERIIAWRIECNKNSTQKINPVNHGTSWQDREEYDLVSNFDKFLENRAEVHKRTPKAIKYMLKKLYFSN